MTNANPTRNKHLGRPGNGGQFAPDERTEGAALLDGAVEEWNVARESIGAIDTQMAAITETEARDVSAVHRALQDGAWTGLREASINFILDKHYAGDYDWGLYDIAQEVQTGHDDRSPSNAGETVSEDEYRALGAADDAAHALAYRHLVGTDPLWTQESYDNHTRAWATVFGPVHPDDAAVPASWSKRPLDAEVLGRLSPEVAAAERERTGALDVDAIDAEIEATDENDTTRMLDLHRKAIKALVLEAHPTAASVVVQDTNGEDGSPYLKAVSIEEANGFVVWERDWDADYATDDYTPYLDRDLDALEQLTSTGWEDTWRLVL
jgi:hypothetical protein